MVTLALSRIPLRRFFGSRSVWVGSICTWRKPQASALTASDLGPSGIRQSVYLMSAILEHAVRSGRIRSNPARGLAPPRPRRRDHVFLTHGQLAALADAAGRWRLLVLVLGYTGLRWGEATALRVCDIDFARRRIDVRRAFSDVGGKIVLGTPKSHLARTVPLPPVPRRRAGLRCPGQEP